MKRIHIVCLGLLVSALTGCGNKNTEDVVITVKDPVDKEFPVSDYFQVAAQLTGSNFNEKEFRDYLKDEGSSKIEEEDFRIDLE